MAKFYGNVGFVKTDEKEDSVWETVTEEKPYFGELTKNTLRYENQNKINDDINISNNVSILADEFAMKNLQFIKYVILNGFKWKVSSIDIAYPRLNLTLGGVYNEQSET